MAEKPEVKLRYLKTCGDCATRHVELPAPLPNIGDDFDWDARDYDGYRLFMLEELTARFPERRNWTPADLEVVVVEAISVVLDQLSDMHDRIQAESYLETARRPSTVRRMLEMIGYKPYIHADIKMLDRVSESKLGADSSSELVNNARLEQLWRYYPHLMEEAKQAGPRSIRKQHRMVSDKDYRHQLLSHPLVTDVDTYSKWTGSWYTHFIVVRLINNFLLDDILSEDSFETNSLNNEDFSSFESALQSYYQDQEITFLPTLIGSTPRSLLQHLIERQRMIGQEILLRDATLVGIWLSLSIRILENYYRSEINDSVRATLTDQAEGFFAAGALKFGEDIVASNIIEALMKLDGIEAVCLNRMKRIGSVYADQSGSGRITLASHEVGVLEDDATTPERGYLRIKLHGGRAG